MYGLKLVASGWSSYTGFDVGGHRVVGMNECEYSLALMITVHFYLQIMRKCSTLVNVSISSNIPTSTFLAIVVQTGEIACTH
jgi:hypothetical protein